MMPLILDSFAGGGGASEGIRLALGRHPDIAVNHDEQALALHAANHPETLHVTEDVWHVDWRKLVAGRPVGLAWFSPDCKHFSKAKGGKPVSKNIRGLAWVVLKVAGLVKPSVIILENVEEFRDWGPLVDDKPCPRRKGMTFKRWATQLRNLGYAVEYREIRACDLRTPTIRKRLFVIARRDGGPIVWPAPTHFDQRTKRKAKQGTLFDTVPAGKPWRTAAECIDWSIPCPSIFTRKKPLADATLRRIARGVMRYVVDNPHPFIIPVTHSGDTRTNPADEPLRTITGASRGEMALITPILAGCGGRAGQSPPKCADEPFNTVTAKADQILVTPYVIRVDQASAAARNGVSPADDPLRTIATAGGMAVVVPHLTKFHGDNPGAPIDGPVPTVTANSFIKRAGCAVPIGLVSACLTPRYGERPGQDPRARDIVEPMATVVPTQNGAALVAAFLAQHNGGMVGHDARDPVSTLTGKCSHQQVVAVSLVNGGPDERRTIGGDIPDHGGSAEGRPGWDRLAPEIVHEHGPLEGHNAEADGVPPQGGLSRGQSRGGRSAASGTGASAGVDRAQGTDTEGYGPQSHQRAKGGQQAGELGDSDPERQHQARLSDGLIQAEEAGPGDCGGSGEAARDGDDLRRGGEEAGDFRRSGVQRGEQVAAFLLKYFGTATGQSLDEPAHTTTAKARLGLVTVTIEGEPWVIVDIGMRMLTPRELFRAQGFGDHYIIDPIFKGKPLTKTAQIRMCGNSVCPPVAEALIAANCADLAMPGWRRAA